MMKSVIPHMLVLLCLTGCAAGTTDSKPAVRFHQKSTCTVTGTPAQTSCELEQTAEGTPQGGSHITVTPMVP